jgi:hypothetical protein
MTHLQLLVWQGRPANTSPEDVHTEKNHNKNLKYQTIIYNPITPEELPMRQRVSL